MAEITYQMVLSTLQTAGLLVGIFYYVMTLRNAEKARELTLKSQKHAEETRKIQLLVDINRDIRAEGILDYQEIMRAEWENYDDFLSKYGFDNNPDFFRKRMALWRQMSMNGLLVKDGILDVDTMITYVADSAFFMWNKYKDVIWETRHRIQNPEFQLGLEYMANEIEKYRLSQGIKPSRDIIIPKNNP